MKLTRVTISGADDKVPMLRLLELSTEYPFVEWGILFSVKLEGTPRYPSWSWKYAMPADVSFSIHLCGSISRAVMSGECIDLRRGWRLQLNGFSQYCLPGLRVAKVCNTNEIILQCSNLEAVERAEVLRKEHSNVSALWDQSGGTGVPMESWVLPMGDLNISYSGGLNEDNVEWYLTRLTKNPEPNPFGIDLESGARTNNELDLDKVVRILEKCKPFVTEIGATPKSAESELYV